MKMPVHNVPLVYRSWRIVAFVAYWALQAFFVGLIALAIPGQMRDDVLHSGSSYGSLLIMSGHGVFVIQIHCYSNDAPDPAYMEHYYPPMDWSTFISETYAFGDLMHDGIHAPSGLGAFRWRFDNQFGIRSMVVMLPLWVFGVSGAIGLILTYAIRRFFRTWKSRRSGAFPIVASETGQPIVRVDS